MGSPLGNASAGVRISDGAHHNFIGGDSQANQGNSISSNGGDGVLLVGSSTSRNTVSGNRIGLTASSSPRGNAGNGVTIIDSPFNVIGGTTPGAANIISANDQFGVSLSGSGATNNAILGNLIGTGVDGTLDVGNGSSGVFIAAPNNTVGGTAPGAGNVISGNDFLGVRLSGADATGNLVQGNLIGTQSDGTTALANAGQGVRIDGGAADNQIGGTAADAGNVIAFNSSHGVAVLDASTGNAIQGNSIFANLGIGIDLGLDGVTANDTIPGAEDDDAGPNNLQNTPVLLGATINGNNLNVTYSVPSSTIHSNYPLSIEFFFSGFLGRETVTDVYSAGDALTSKTVTFDLSSLSISTFNSVVATATDATGNTSEFSGRSRVFTLPSLPSSGSGSIAGSYQQANASQPTTLQGQTYRWPIVETEFARSRLGNGSEFSGLQPRSFDLPTDLLAEVARELEDGLAFKELAEDDFAADVAFAWLLLGQHAQHTGS